MDCPGCFNADKDPKRLACAHTFCVDCIEKKLEEGSDKKQKIKCPTCDEVTEIPEGGVSELPTNLPWVMAYKMLKEYPPVSDKMVKCGFCNVKLNVTEMRHCAECDKAICLKCALHHLRAKETRAHDIKNPNDICCMDHGKKCEFHCQKCRKFMCKTEEEECSKDHPESIEPFVEKVGEKIEHQVPTSMQSMIQMLEDYEKMDITEEQKVIEKKLAELEATKTAIKARAQLMVDSVNAAKEQLLSAVDDWEKGATFQN